MASHRTSGCVSELIRQRRGEGWDEYRVSIVREGVGVGGDGGMGYPPHTPSPHHQKPVRENRAETSEA